MQTCLGALVLIKTVKFIDKHRNIHVDQMEGVESVTVTQKGSGYATAPTVTFVGGDTYGADASGAGSAQQITLLI